MKVFKIQKTQSIKLGLGEPEELNKHVMCTVVVPLTAVYLQGNPIDHYPASRMVCILVSNGHMQCVNKLIHDTLFVCDRLIFVRS